MMGPPKKEAEKEELQQNRQEHQASKDAIEKNLLLEEAEGRVVQMSG